MNELLKGLCLLCSLVGFLNAGINEDLFSAVRYGNLERLKSIIEAGEVDIDQLEFKNSGMTPLQVAAFHGNVNLFPYLLENGAYNGGIKDPGNTPLTSILRSSSDTLTEEDRLEGVRMLIEHGARVNTRSDRGETPLMFACQNVHSKELIEYLLSKGALVDTPDEIDGSYPLGYAFKGNNVKALCVLALHDVDLNYAAIGRGSWGYLALHGNLYMINQLRKHLSFDPNMRDVDSMTPLMMATIGSKVDVLEFLIQNGGDINLETTKEVKIPYTPHGELFSKRMVFPKGASALIFARNLSPEYIQNWIIQNGGDGRKDIEVKVESGWF